MANGINIEGLRINRWAESLSADNKQLIFPETEPKNFCYVWNKTPMSERKNIYLKFKDVVGEGGVESNCTFSDSTLGHIYNQHDLLLSWSTEWFRALPYKSKLSLRDKHEDDPNKKKMNPDTWFTKLSKEAKIFLYNSYKKEINVKPYPNR